MKQQSKKLEEIHNMIEMKRREGSRELESRLNKQNVKDFRKCC